MGKETGAKTETYMCMRRGTCSDRHLWKQTHAAEAVHTDIHTHVETCSHRYMCADTRAPGETRRNRDMENTKTYRHTKPSCGLLLAPSALMHSEETKTTSGPSLRQLHP